MKPERRAFMPISPDIDDTKIERLAAEKGVGAYVKPAGDARREGAADLPPPQAADDEAEPMTLPNGATPRARMKSVNIELPDYVWTDLKIRAAQRQTSVRHLVMTALRNDGIAIQEIDMIEDGRRTRGTARPH